MNINKKIDQILSSLSFGTTLYQISVIALKVMAALLVLGYLFVLIGFLLEIGSVNNPGDALGMLLGLALFTVAFYLAFRVVIYRSVGISALSRQEYPVVPLAAALLRLIGELQALAIGALGVVAGVSIWFGGDISMPFEAGMNFISLLYWNFFMPLQFPPFLAGIALLLISMLNALVVLIVFYLLSELLTLLRDIALNSKRY
ncbi:MAG: hypothetical protein FH749_11770 [Firmicutes bacterium]|nr:hypothetical protein [Bacillota bacterium]